MDKRAITELVFEEFSKNHKPGKVDAKQASIIWWWPDYDDVVNYRLTLAGRKVFCKVLKYYTLPFEFQNSGAQIKKLASIQTPYFVASSVNEIILFSDQYVVAASLYKDFNRYLELLDINKTS